MWLHGYSDAGTKHLVQIRDMYINDIGIEVERQCKFWQHVRVSSLIFCGEV